MLFQLHTDRTRKYYSAILFAIHRTRKHYQNSYINIV